MSRNLDYCKRQYELSMLRAERWLASATSGHYKQRKIMRGTDERNADGGIVFRDLTDEEKLADCIATADRHIELAQQFHEALGEEDR